jgi:hypothetical protein
VHLVFLAFEPAEEPADAAVAGAVPLDDQAALIVGQVLPRRVERDAQPLGLPLQLGQLRSVVRLRPRLDRALANRLRRIRDDERHVELDDVAEAVARRAGAERVVEGEQPRLRIFVGDVAAAALETLAELMQRGSTALRGVPEL